MLKTCLRLCSVLRINLNFSHGLWALSNAPSAQCSKFSFHHPLTTLQTTPNSPFPQTIVAQYVPSAWDAFSKLFLWPVPSLSFGLSLKVNSSEISSLSTQLTASHHKLVSSLIPPTCNYSIYLLVHMFTVCLPQPQYKLQKQTAHHWMHST